MFKTYTRPEFSYSRDTDQDAEDVVHHQVIVVGAGPSGMATAIGLAQQGIAVVLLDSSNTVSTGSRAVCYSQRSLDIADRLGIGQRLVEKGTSWSFGRTFFGDTEVDSFNLTDTDSRHPAFVNLQQYYLEEYLIDRIGELSAISLRWENRVVRIDHSNELTLLKIDTPEGSYQLSCDYLIAGDGANSFIRSESHQDFKGQIFHNRFLIADVVMETDKFPVERWLWFNPAFHDGQTALIQPQADNVWRIDFDIGWQADPAEERKPENVIARVEALLGGDVSFELEWASVYTFTCRRMDRFRKANLFFVGDAAHQVSPFSARGINSGFEDADNLVWKLRLVIDGLASDSLLDSYSDERCYAADRNMQLSTNATDFITPKAGQCRVFRDAVLDLAKDYDFARTLVNSGRLSEAVFIEESPLNTSDADHFDCDVLPGAPCADGPVLYQGKDTFLRSVLGISFTGLLFVDQEDEASRVVAQLDAQLAELAELAVPVKTYIIAPHGMELALPEGGKVIVDHRAVVRQRLDAKAGTFYLCRPDQLIAARMRRFDMPAVLAAHSRALGNYQEYEENDNG
ncbi:FAD-dependent oxidoreductase [Amphritea balenae]|uniref:FAD-binding protein n=1 Tax=Amphritea balenae TaxID=452629 RepID=A0A3P1SX47_9GAMM|nr:FAD-dependent oxidoreductase [Amphritea balenae]RRD00693.1 FAD-binding protein [Amphritea balenae]GGK68678.1 oxidoreductase [Amphritea balenae]